MNDLLQKDYASKVFEEEAGYLGTQWYLPHHPV
jgi:hypothetical protein